jgi:hypothetical protein
MIVYYTNDNHIKMVFIFVSDTTGKYLSLGKNGRISYDKNGDSFLVNYTDGDPCQADRKYNTILSIKCAVGKYTCLCAMCTEIVIALNFYGS